GLSRAARRLFDGDLSGALLLHPLSPVVVPLVLAVCARAACQHVLGGAPASCRVSPALRRAESVLAWWLAGLVLAVWAARFLGAFAGPVRVISLWAH
ncbi:MAG TPA: hypothetical protein VJU61_22835, partial [Polyangiaceae bacterium]|nr:hypothetical protein [Polyangiaceae bacterium]